MTLISHRHKFIFLANPKCASTSVHEFLRPFSDKAYTLSVYQKPLGTHANARKVRSYMEKRGYHWDDYFVFTTIRHPLKRIRSCWYYEIDFLQNKDPIDLFIRTPRDFKRYVMEDWFFRRFYDISDFVSDENGHCLVDKIIKVEEIDSELPPILEKCGISKRWEDFDRKNVTKKRRELVYDDEMIEHIRKIRPNDAAYYPGGWDI
jgi:hypothetical protein